jgi:glutamate dehydrogenase/leucine dehydrogenase
MEILRLRTLDAFIAFDLADSTVSAGGTRLAPDVSEREAGLLARAMTYKFAALGLPMGGAKGAIRGSAAERPELVRRYCDEIRPLVEARRFLTGPDLGTFDADFEALRPPGDVPGIMAQPMNGVAFEDVLTGFGVVVAAETALGSLAGRTVAIEGFGKVGGGVAREAARRGARVIAISTIAGAVADPRGLDVERLWQERAKHGDDLVRHLGLDCRPLAALFDVEADVLVPGARPGVIDRERASRLPARIVAPAANVPYVAGAVDLLRDRGVIALADFVCNAGAVLGYLAPPDSSHDDVLATVERRIGELVATSARHPRGHHAGACAIAEEFLRSWRGPQPTGPPLA